MEKTNAHAQIAKLLKHEDMLRYLGLLLKITQDKDAMVRKVLRVLSVMQDIKLSDKDSKRKLIRAWFRVNYGDRRFFADSDYHRPKHRRRFTAA